MKMCNFAISLLFSLLFLSSRVSAQNVSQQPPAVTNQTGSQHTSTWNQQYEDERSLVPLLIKQAKDESYYVAAMGSYPKDEKVSIVVLKLDAQGNKLWLKAFDEDAILDRTYAMDITNDGGLILGGMTWFKKPKIYSLSVSDGLLLKIDASGNKIWRKAFTGKGKSLDYIWDVRQTVDDKLIVVGMMEHGWMSKLDNTGNIEWERTLDKESGTSIIVTVNEDIDGSFFAAGLSDNPHKPIAKKQLKPNYIALVKISGNGDILSQIFLSDDAFQPAGSLIFRLLRTTDGGFVTVGSIDNTMTILKSDSNWNVAFRRSIGDKNQYVGSRIRQTSDNGFIVTGNEVSNGGKTYPSIFVMKLDSSGEVIWKKAYNGKSEKVKPWPNDIIQTADGGYVICAQTNELKQKKASGDRSFVWILKLDSNGDCLECN